MLAPQDLLDVCNAVRRAGGADELEVLQPGVASQSDSCLIARNLNFACVVRMIAIPYDTPKDGFTSVTSGSIWAMGSNDPRLLQVAETLGWEKIEQDQKFEGYSSFWMNGQTSREYWVLIPPDLRDSAIAFDKARYPNELYL